MFSPRMPAGIRNGMRPGRTFRDDVVAPNVPRWSTDVIPTIAALGSDNGIAVGDCVYVENSGNTYRCTAVTATTSTWRPADNVWRVRDYSSLTTDVAIQLAIDDLPSTGGVVEIEQGVWTVSNTITLPKTQDIVTIRGAGTSRGTLLRITSLADAVIEAGNATYESSPSLYGVVIEDLAIDHASAGAAGSVGIELWNARDSVIRGCDIRNLDVAIALKGECRYCEVSRNHTIGCTTGIWLYDGARSNWVEHNSVQGGTTSCKVEGGSNAGLTQNVIRENGFEGFTGTGVDVDSSTAVVSQLVIFDNRIESTETSTTGVAVDSSSTFVAIRSYFQSVTTLISNGVADTATGATKVNNNPIDTFVQLSDLDGTRRGLLRSGTGTPESNVTGDPGDMWLRTDGSTGTTLYIKETGTGTTTGWVAK